MHFSAVAMDGYRMLVPGQQVTFRAEAVNQDGFAYRAVKVWTDDAEPSDRDRTESGSAGYQGWLTLTFDMPVTDDNSETQA